MEVKSANYSFDKLNSRAYKSIQQIAKKMNLPVNFKKIHLIEIIIAKQTCTQQELDDIIERIRLERKLKTNTGKNALNNYIQASEISSTCDKTPSVTDKSPPMTDTPKAHDTVMIRPIHNIRRLLKPTIDNEIKTYPAKKKTAGVTPILSDRVLRSSHNPNDSTPKTTKISIFSQRLGGTKFNFNTFKTHSLQVSSMGQIASNVSTESQSAPMTSNERNSQLMSITSSEKASQFTYSMSNDRSQFCSIHTYERSGQFASINTGDNSFKLVPVVTKIKNRQLVPIATNMRSNQLTSVSTNIMNHQHISHATNKWNSLVDPITTNSRNSQLIPSATNELVEQFVPSASNELIKQLIPFSANDRNSQFISTTGNIQFVAINPNDRNSHLIPEIVREWNPQTVSTNISDKNNQFVLTTTKYQNYQNVPSYTNKRNNQCVPMTTNNWIEQHDLSINESNDQVAPTTVDEMQPACKKQRKISGISPLTSPECRTLRPVLNVTQSDGEITKIHTSIIQKPMSLINRRINKISDSRLNIRRRLNMTRNLNDRESLGQNYSNISSYKAVYNKTSTYDDDLIIDKSQILIKENLVDPYKGNLTIENLLDPYKGNISKENPVDPYKENLCKENLVDLHTRYKENWSEDKSPDSYKGNSCKENLIDPNIDSDLVECIETGNQNIHSQSQNNECLVEKSQISIKENMVDSYKEYAAEVYSVDTNTRNLIGKYLVESNTENSTKEHFVEYCSGCATKVKLGNSITEQNNFEINKIRNENVDLQYHNINNNENLPKMTYYYQQSLNKNGTCDEEATNSSEEINVNISSDSQNVPNSIKLPMIENAFSKFSGYNNRSVMKPIYVQVSADAEKTEQYVQDESFTSVLEKLINYKGQFITNDYLPVISTSPFTKCVFASPVMVTTKVQAPVTIYDEYNALLMQTNQYDNIVNDYLPYVQDTLTLNQLICDEVMSSSTTFDNVSENDVSANVTIPDMVEDALELISQDGEFMERIEIDVDMHCLNCSWTGPQHSIDNHYRTCHMSEIETYDLNEWVTTYTLGSLVQRDVWTCRVVQYQNILYVLSARYEDPDIFMASVHSLTSYVDIKKKAQIITYNKVSGEPYTWEGAIEELPHTMPYYKNTDCFKIELERINLLPNSANLKLVNCALVVDSPTKVIVGQPALNDIHINLFINVTD